MCWIWIVNFDKIKVLLEEQQDRWLDSLWLINLSTLKYNKTIRAKLNDYHDVIDSIKEKEWMTIVHHRAASVWAVTQSNAHPFFGRQFALMQNWTSRIFYNTYKDKYKKETDSETLLSYIEENANSLEEAYVLLEDIKDTLGIIILTDVWAGKILIYMDWARESYVNVEDWKLIEFRNYKPTYYAWYENKWFILFDMNLNIIESDYWELNKKEFIDPFTYAKPTKKNQYNSYSSYYWCWYDTGWDFNEVIDTWDLHELWMARTTISRLEFAWVYTVDELFTLSLNDLNMMTGIYRTDIEEVERVLRQYNSTLYDNKTDIDYFYSEEILWDPILLFNDIYWYLLTTWWTIQQYTYHNMWIPYNKSPSKILWRDRWKDIKKQYKAASQEFEKNYKQLPLKNKQCIR